MTKKSKKTLKDNNKPLANARGLFNSSTYLILANLSQTLYEHPQVH